MMEIKRVLKDRLSARVCVIGAGPSGIAAIKNLQEHGITNVTVFEKNNQIGGNWVYDEQNEHSSVYETTHIISSKRWSEFEDFPMPVDYPDYPSHSQLLKYFQSYVEHFHLDRYIRFNTVVQKVHRLDDNTWHVIYEDAQGIHEACYDYLLVANGHHWDPFMPVYPGVFDGEILHSHQYKKASIFKGKRVLVVGGGNSACDVAVEISRVAPGTCISMRRGYHIFPKFIFGKPTDVAVAKIQWMPSWLRQKFISLVIRGLQGRYAKYKLMKPDCGPLEIHPTINSELLYFIRHGKIHPCPGISRFEGNTVHFTDGTQGEFDTIIFATGYQISFPFFDKSCIDFSNSTTIPLYRKMMHPEFENLYFIGLCQPQGCIWPLADYQSKIVARIIAGTLKRPEQLHRKIAKEINKPHHRFKSHMRHALEVDYHIFRKELLEMLGQKHKRLKFYP
ncbi:TPA: SidA/IucD/PvdA family monooxygenase [Legionella pneumophila]|nr:SidA/IucD/PvdA family monooxygenase [Legionella pneumophila]HAT8814204.1 SidA/IucD/PvdA family monooxygenase [Legionella pneumophila subsp. pneumophila]HAT6824200.1 SidA/IucD/PvdA family monooxygenase [Legionella pneumophila]HAT6943086.1 SidA/IucD/PvdA family monooxygenase [Legionella pneumophila]HAT7877526.1 SidA/IucD/PvdA family monooxygenase [Legionella pneumophila]